MKTALTPGLSTRCREGNRMNFVRWTEDNFLREANLTVRVADAGQSPNKSSQQQRAAPASRASPSAAPEVRGIKRRSLLQVAGVLKSIPIKSKSARSPSGRKMLAEYRNRAERQQAENSRASRLTASSKAALLSRVALANSRSAERGPAARQQGPSRAPAGGLRKPAEFATRQAEAVQRVYKERPPGGMGRI